MKEAMNVRPYPLTLGSLAAPAPTKRKRQKPLSPAESEALKKHGPRGTLGGMARGKGAR